MITGANVLGMLIPSGGWYIAGNDYENIQFLECEPITKAEFEAGFAKYEAFKLEQDAKRAADKAALLERLGITEAEAQLLLA
jgi:hypothetical protein